MIELPFIMEFELDFSLKAPSNEILTKIYNEIINIIPNPQLKIILGRNTLNGYLYDFLVKLNENKFKYSILTENPVIDKIFKKFNEILKMDFYITKDNYNFNNLYNLNANLFIPVDIKKDLYNFLKKINNKNIGNIVIIHKKTNLDYEYLKQQIELIKRDNNLNKKCFIRPYLEHNEQEKFYCKEKDKIRPFLTCAALWTNPTINSVGEIDMPCFKEKSLLESNFFELWNSERINNIRCKLIDKKQFNICKYCQKFYNKNFLAVSDGLLNYKGCNFKFNDVLNYIPSAPIIAIVEIDEKYVVEPIPLYSDDDILKIYTEKNLIAVIRSR